MKKYFRHLKILIIPALLLGLSIATWSDAGKGQAPNRPGEARQTTGPAEDREPNMSVAEQELTIPAETQEPTSPEEGQRPTPAGSWDAYRIVVERNMFSRQRGPRLERTRRQVPVAPAAPDPESYVVLKGIVQEDGEFIAFLEDTQSGQIRRVRQGDSVVRGKVKALTLDSIEYESGDRTTTVTMGLNLQGGRGGAAFAGMYELSQTSSAMPAGGTTETTTAPSEDEAEILRQLMERRQQQVGN
ncbi:MAG: hypothetical protein AMJ65_10685 [Phycisphaerae bacterium SG8_4]|nr:MAG: hypothetical protein AMJ65_10685 [Phycisphaerae bacterium SG8_4]